MWHLRSPRARRRAMRPVDPKIVDRLNDALTCELSVVNQYFLHARMLDNWGFPKLGKVFYDLSIDEMKDADTLISRVLLFEGHPNVQRLLAIRVGEDAEEMLRLALEGEIAAVAQYNAAAQECHDLGDHGTASLFEEMVLDEEKHADWFESQVEPLPSGCRARSGGSQNCSTHCSKARVSGTARQYPATPCSSRSTRVTASG